VLLVGDGLGRGAALAAALLTALSPAMVYYSRYYIQETLLVLFTFLLMGAAWRFIRSGRPGWLIAAGLSAGFMHATKETCIIAWAALFAAYIFMRVTHGPCPAEAAPAQSGKQRFWSWLGVAVLLGAGLSAVFMSGFFSNPGGIAGSYATWLNYFRRTAGESVHDHPWPYYFRLLLFWRAESGLWWSEGAILALAAVGAVAALFRKDTGRGRIWFVRFSALYTLLMAAVYSFIAYKTPWCMLGFLHGMIVLAGFGVAQLVYIAAKPHWRAALAFVLAVVFAHLGWQAWRASYALPADPANPYVYAHTSPDVLRLAEDMQELAAARADGHEQLIRVISPEYWPLPWYLRKFDAVGYWEEIPDDVQAPIIITCPEYQPLLDELLEGDYHREYYSLRPGVLLALYVESDWWDAARPPSEGTS